MVERKSVRTRRERRHVIYATVIACLAALAGVKGILPVFRSHLMTYLGVGDAGLGLLFSTPALAGLAGNLIGGPLVDRWGARGVIRTCLAGVAVALLVAGVAGARYRVFLLAAGISGFFSPPLFIAVNAYLARLFPRHRRRIISLNFASTSFGGMFFPLAAESLLALAAAAPSVTFAHVLHGPLLIAGLLLLAASFIYRPRQPAPVSRPRPPARTRAVFRLPLRLFFLVGLMSLHGTADGLLYTWMARFLESASFPSRGFPPGAVLSGYALAYLLSRVILAVLPEHCGRRAFLVLPGLVGGTVMVAAILSRDYRLTAAGYVLAAFCWSFEFPVMVNMVFKSGRHGFGAAMAVNGLVGGLAVFASMNLMGWSLEKIGEARMWRLMLVPAAVFIVIGLGGLAWLALFDRPGSDAGRGVSAAGARLSRRPSK